MGFDELKLHKALHSPMTLWTIVLVTDRRFLYEMKVWTTESCSTESLTILSFLRRNQNLLGRYTIRLGEFSKTLLFLWVDLVSQKGAIPPWTGEHLCTSICSTKNKARTHHHLFLFWNLKSAISFTSPNTSPPTRSTNLKPNLHYRKTKHWISKGIFCRTMESALLQRKPTSPRQEVQISSSWNTTLPSWCMKAPWPSGIKPKTARWGKNEREEERGKFPSRPVRFALFPQNTCRCVWSWLKAGHGNMDMHFSHQGAVRNAVWRLRSSVSSPTRWCFSIFSENSVGESSSHSCSKETD